MPKKLIAIPEGILMRVAESKGFNTLSALKEKSGVDRKTLRAINAGQQVKETTLQSIADRLRVPLAHLLALPHPRGTKSASAANTIIGKSLCRGSMPRDCDGWQKPERSLGR